MNTRNPLHPRNQHKEGYDFGRLVKNLPELKAFLIKNPKGQTTIPFQNIQAVRALNQALLKTYYSVDFWNIPDNYLCPPIPGRVDYIHYLADLLASENEQNSLPTGPNIQVLDIGTGANLVYPLTGQSEYGWSFTGSDIDPRSIKTAKQISQFNKLNIKIIQQKNHNNIFKGIIGPKDYFHLTMCNPPFHSSPDAAKKGTQRKWRNLGKSPSNRLNFGGQNTELWCPGGEIKFITRMIEESTLFAKQCIWYTSLVSKKDNLFALKKQLRKAKVADFKVINMAQGQKTSRFIAWSFITKNQRSLATFNK